MSRLSDLLKLGHTPHQALDIIAAEGKSRISEYLKSSNKQDYLKKVK